MAQALWIGSFGERINGEGRGSFFWLHCVPPCRLLSVWLLQCRVPAMHTCSSSIQGFSSTQVLHCCGFCNNRILWPARPPQHLAPAVHSGQQHLWPTAFSGTLQCLWQDSSQWLVIPALTEEKPPTTCVLVQHHSNFSAVRDHDFFSKIRISAIVLRDVRMRCSIRPLVEVKTPYIHPPIFFRVLFNFY